MFGLGSLEVFAQTIQRVEGWFPPGPGYPAGSVSYRNNNPGNLIYTPYYAAHFGATPCDGGFCRFPDVATGWAALRHQIELDAARGLSIAAMMRKYAPAEDGNDPASYAATIARALGVPVTTPVALAIAPGSGGPPGLPFSLGLPYCPAVGPGGTSSGRSARRPLWPRRALCWSRSWGNFDFEDPPRDRANVARQAAALRDALTLCDARGAPS